MYFEELNGTEIQLKVSITTREIYFNYFSADAKATGDNKQTYKKAMGN